MRSKRADTGLTELESHILSVIWRLQPATTYQVRTEFAHRLARDMLMSQGTIYPTIRRLRAKGYVEAAALADARGAEVLSCTIYGENALRRWLKALPEQLPEDPLRNRITALSLLPRSEQLEWAASARAALERDLVAIEEIVVEEPEPLFEMAQDNARSTLVARIRWLEKVENRLHRWNSGP